MCFHSYACVTVSYAQGMYGCVALTSTTVEDHTITLPHHPLINPLPSLSLSAATQHALAEGYVAIEPISLSTVHIASFQLVNVTTHTKKRER